MTAYRLVNLAIAFFIELAALAALCFWGFTASRSATVQALLGIGAPVVAAVLWGLFAAPRAVVTVPEWFRYFIKVVVFGLASAGLATHGHLVLGIALGAIFVVNTVLIVAGRLDEGVTTPAQTII